jgi:hypothetical protein
MGTAEQAIEGKDLYREAQHPGQTRAGALYAIRVKGELGSRWEEWFGGLTMTVEPDGETLLSGRIVDQAALHGVLDRVQRLGLELLAVNRTESAPECDTDYHSN